MTLISVKGIVLNCSIEEPQRWCAAKAIIRKMKARTTRS
jgi:uncharacterized phage protein gp47/JayE